MPSLEETLRNYNAKREAKAAAIRQQAAANQAPAKLQTCGKCQAPCSGSIQALGQPLCGDCFTARLDEQTRRARTT
jgi:hypothetical protein